MPRSFFGIQTSLPAKSTRNKIAGIFSVRVKYAMLEGKTQPTAFKNFGEYSSLGGVFFTSLNNPNPNPDFTTDNFALPLFPNMSNIPLENEIIYVINLPSNNVQSNVNSVNFYYFQPVNIWNSSHHNGQHEEQTEPWVPQVEDINTDASSIYLTSTQIIPIEAASTSYLSYFSPPTTTSEYNGEQIILNSGRLLLNSKSDSILLSSFNTINLNSINSVNIDSPTFIAKSDTIALGDKNASEPIILGNKFLTDFEELCKNLNSLSTALQTPQPSPVAPYVLAVTPSAVQVASSAAKMLSNIKRYKSTVTTSK